MTPSSHQCHLHRKETANINKQPMQKQLSKNLNIIEESKISLEALTFDKIL